MPEGNLTYSAILAGLEKRYEDDKEPFCICGLSLGAMLALDYTIWHKNKVSSLDFTSGLKDIRCPVAIICGEKDHANLKAANQFKQLLPQAKLHIIPGAGHEINKTAPEAISAVLRSLNME